MGIAGHRPTILLYMHSISPARGCILSSEHVERRLAAVLAADVAGYSRLMGRDEEATLAQLKSFRKALVDPAITTHRGRIVKTTGDGMLVEFASAVEAARCAVEVQRGMARQNADVPQDFRIEFRIGIHVGDIIIDDDDIFGDGVNIAARLEGLAEPGGVCISDDAQRQIRGKVDFAFDDMGPQTLKNIAQSMRAWRMRDGSASASALPKDASAGFGQALALPEKPSIAVLPFQNMSGDPEQEYFADGMVEEITTAIARLPWLFVIARNSSFTYKGKAVDVKQVGRELGVRYVLEGSVRKGGNRVRITGQLIDTTTGAHIWADRIDGSLEDVFELQDQVASSVVGAIEPKLRLSEIDRATRKPTASLDAYDLFLRALAQAHKMTPESLTEAIALSHKALQLDSSYAAAAGLAAWCRGIQRGQGWVLPAGPEDAEGILLGRIAIEFGANDPDALWMAAYGLAIATFDLTIALSALDRALVLNPNSAHAWGTKALVESFRGDARAAVAVEASNRAIRLSPLDPLSYIYKFAGALAYLGAGQYQEAMGWIDDALREQPRFHASFRVKVALCGLLGQSEEGRDWLVRLLDLQPGLTITAWLKHAATFLAPGTRERMVKGFRKAGLPEE
jgi:TolB-like protein/class 3 adenylate cyclase/tetratricopeptide (TPR) repeat protein